MRVVAVAIAVLVSALTPVHAQPATAERDPVLKTLQAFFDTMTARDVQGARKILEPQGRFHAMKTRDGKVEVRSFSNEEYFADLNASKQRMQERIWSPELRVSGLIATVWAPYDFWIDGKFSHCGVDAFDLIKTAEGWKIAGGVYTVESKCDASPLGPPKQ
ncbi:MAG TPA: nuclear transport factor 2 family protein [Vicinamibacterales bacterium]|jgi:hypothetical protein